MNYKTSLVLATVSTMAGVVALLLMAFPQAHVALITGASVGIGGGFTGSIKAICEAIRGE